MTAEVVVAAVAAVAAVAVVEVGGKQVLGIPRSFAVVDKQLKEGRPDKTLIQLAGKSMAHLDFVDHHLVLQRQHIDLLHSLPSVARPHWVENGHTSPGRRHPHESSWTKGVGVKMGSHRRDPDAHPKAAAVAGLGLGPSWRGSKAILVGPELNLWPVWPWVHEGVRDKVADSSLVAHLYQESYWKKVVDYQWESCCPFGNSLEQRELSYLFV